MNRKVIIIGAGGHGRVIGDIVHANGDKFLGFIDDDLCKNVLGSISEINADSTIGRHSIINSSAVVEHDNKIDDFVHIYVGAKLGGNVSIGKKTWVGIGATVINNISICENCMIGAGAVVVRSIDERGKYVGVQARAIIS